MNHNNQQTIYTFAFRANTSSAEYFKRSLNAAYPGNNKHRFSVLFENVLLKEWR